MRVPEKEMRIRRAGNIRTKNYKFTKKIINVHIQKLQQIPSRINTKRSTNRHIIVKKSLSYTVK